jgi:hypothetical protein
LHEILRPSGLTILDYLGGIGPDPSKETTGAVYVSCCAMAALVAQVRIHAVRIRDFIFGSLGCNEM